MMYQKNRKMKITVLQSKETKNENRYCKLDIPVPIYIVYIRHTFRWRLTMGSTSDTLSVNYKFETSSVMFP